MKKLLTFIAAIALAALMLVSGCSVLNGKDGRDGKDAQDVSVYDLYEAAKSIPGKENLTLDEFLKEYLTYDNADVEAAKSLKATINRSLMSGVSILSRFGYTKGSRPSSIPGLNTSYTEYLVYTGSGVIIWLDKDAGDAYVVTNCHVVYDDTADSIFCNDVRLYLYGQDESEYNYVIDSNYNITGDEKYRIEAEVIGASVTYDIALLKVEGSEVLKKSDAVAASFSMQADVSVGEFVYAVGNASGEGVSAADGIISRDSEEVLLTLSDKAVPSSSDYHYYRALRTTAPINHGNSGGGLFNSSGEIIAIVNAKDEGEDIDNMGYALPANSVRRLLRLMYDNYVSNGYRMKSGGGVDKALLNIKHTVTYSYAVYNKETGLAEIYELVKVDEISGMPAREVLKVDDYLKAVEIISSDGTVKESLKITRRYHLPEAMLSVRRGDTVKLTVERDGSDIEISVKFNSNSYFTHYE